MINYLKKKAKKCINLYYNYEHIIIIIGIFLFSYWLTSISSFFPLESGQEYVNIFISFFKKYDLLYFLVSALLVFSGVIIYYISSFQEYHFLNIISISCLLLGLIFIIFKIEIRIYKINIIKFIVPALFTLSYFCWKRANLLFIRYDKYNRAKNFDNCITKLEEDRLSREPLVERVLQIIKETNKDWTLRIGIYGEWGEGKTSLMSLIKRRCNEIKNDNDRRKYATVWFNPWHYNTKEALWTGFRETIEQKVIEARRGALFPNFFKEIVKTITLNFLKSNSSTKLVLGKWIKRLINNSTISNQRLLKNKIENYLDTYLPQEKIIMFIDDLDRIEDGKRILELLKGLKELVNLKGIIFIMAFDKNFVAERIENELSKRDNANYNGMKFLEKIIDYPIYLSNLTRDESNKLVDHLLQEYEEVVDKESILEIVDLLPTNPRGLKRFFHYLKVLNSTFEKFFKQEVNWNFLYLAQLLKLEFPKIFKNVNYNSECQEVFSRAEPSAILKAFNTNGAGLREKNDEENKIGEYLTKKELQTIKNDIKVSNENRLINLIDALQKQVINGGMKNLDILFYFQAIEYPGLMTEKQFKEKYKKVKEDFSKFFNIELIEDQKMYLKHLIEYRKQLLNSKRNHREVEKEILLIGKQICNILEDKNRINKYGYLFIKKLIDDLLKDTINEDSKFQTQIKELIMKITRLGELTPGIFLDIIEPWRKIRVEKMNGSNRSLLSEFERDLVESLELILAKKLINKFGEKEYIKNKGDAEKWLLLTPRESFHNKNNYEELNELSIKAQKNEVIRDNFFNYLFLLTESAKGKTGIIRPEDSEELLQNKEFLKIIWNGAVSASQSEGSIRFLSEEEKAIMKDFYQQFKEIYDTTLADILYLPSWFEDVEKK